MSSAERTSGNWEPNPKMMQRAIKAKNVWFGVYFEVLEVVSSAEGTPGGRKTKFQQDAIGHQG